MDKASIGGRKLALRRLTGGVAREEVIAIDRPTGGDHDDRELLGRLVVRGEIVGRASLAEAREHHRSARAELPIDAMKLSRGEPVIPTVYLEPRDA